MTDKVFNEKNISLKNEHAFLEEMEAVKNPNGVYLYVSSDGKHMLHLDSILQDYKEWLIENKLITK